MHTCIRIRVYGLGCAKSWRRGGEEGGGVEEGRVGWKRGGVEEIETYTQTHTYRHTQTTRTRTLTRDTWYFESLFRVESLGRV